MSAQAKSNTNSDSAGGLRGSSSASEGGVDVAEAVPALACDAKLNNVADTAVSYVKSVNMNWISAMTISKNTSRIFVGVFAIFRVKKYFIIIRQAFAPWPTKSRTRARPSAGPFAECTPMMNRSHTSSA